MTTDGASKAEWLRIGDARRHLGGMANSTFYCNIKKGEIPRPVKFGRASLWSKAELDAYIDARKAERDAAATKH